MPNFIVRRILLYITTHNHAEMTYVGNFWNLLYQHGPHLGQILQARVDLRCTLKFRRIWYMLSAIKSERNPILPYFFQICHSAVVPPSIVETKLNADARLRGLIHTKFHPIGAVCCRCGAKTSNSPALCSAQLHTMLPVTI